MIQPSKQKLRELKNLIKNKFGRFKNSSYLCIINKNNNNMKNLTQDTIKKIENTTLRIQASHRGGGVEIDLTEWGYPGEKMTAYQNYLGGGMLGSIGNDSTIRNWRSDSDLSDIANKLARYFHSLTNHLIS